jgi:hypothetical protein
MHLMLPGDTLLGFVLLRCSPHTTRCCHRYCCCHSVLDMLLLGCGICAVHCLLQTLSTQWEASAAAFPNAALTRLACLVAICVNDGLLEWP